jgi:ABC-2 type transport system permease protein
MAWVILFFLLLVTGFNFYAGVSVLNHGPTEVTVVESFFNTIFFWFAFLLLFPLLTMRLFSEEYRSGTIEPLMTAPVRDAQVVLAKFFGVLFLYCVLWIPTGLYFLIFWWQTRLQAAGAIGAYIGSYLLLLLMGAFYLSIGCFCSSLTRHQITAAVMTFCLVSLVFFASLLSFLSGSIGTLMRSVSISFSPIDQMTEFSRGLYDTRPIIWYLVMTGLFLFLTLQSFQSRRWR